MTWEFIVDRKLQKNSEKNKVECDKLRKTSTMNHDDDDESVSKQIYYAIHQLNVNWSFYRQKMIFIWGFVEFLEKNVRLTPWSSTTSTEKYELTIKIGKFSH